MKRVIAFVGSARKRHTYNAALQFLDSLQSFGDVEYEIVILSKNRDRQKNGPTFSEKISLLPEKVSL